MKQLFDKYGIKITEDKLQKFEKYYELLVYFNSKFNITAITEKKEVYKKHFIDSLLGITLFDKGSHRRYGSTPMHIEIDDETYIITDDFLEGFDEEMEQFLKKLLNE